jgi:hypothetical protein
MQTERDRNSQPPEKRRRQKKENTMTINRKSFLLITALTALQTAFAGTNLRLAADPHDQAAIRPGPFAFAVTTNGDFVNPISQIGIVDLGRGMFRPLATLASPPVGIAKDADGQLYAVDYLNNLVGINPLSGEVTLIGPTGITKQGPIGPAVDVFTSLSNGELYLMDYDNILYSVDKTTGAATMIGSTGIRPINTPFYGTSFSGDCDALYFTVEENDEDGGTLIPATLYRINPRTAVATRVGPTASFIGGSGFVGNTLYAFKIDENLIGGTVGPQVLALQLANGGSQKVASLNVPSVFGAVSFGEERRGCRAGR